jgi:hypothetical protein
MSTVAPGPTDCLDCSVFGYLSLSIVVTLGLFIAWYFAELK